jgi:hypothetical protein
MRSHTTRFLAAFTEEAASWGWAPDFVEQGDYANFAKPHGDGLRAHLGLCLNNRDEVWLNPSVGVTHVVVAELTTRFFGLRGLVSLAGATLADLVYATGESGSTKWVLRPEGQIPLMVRTVLADVERYGQSFLDQYTSLDHLIRGLEQRAMINMDFAHLAVACAVADDHPRARLALSRLHDWTDRQPPAIVEQTERFFAGFHAHFDIPVA